MFQNHLRMARYLSFYKDNLLFVAKSYFKEKFVDKDAIKNCKSFILTLEMGRKDFALGNSSR